ncbi:hypothetical protein RRG08_066102 [Elysia crispata]|uniref:Uncharacterized protein n=1 Tax=Elysia crispata TaxID=231223 RepID=A0AAE0ZIF1_9GAST|nr:hypothetical protein RRG08_066102 [Elysia crispata]
MADKTRPSVKARRILTQRSTEVNAKVSQGHWCRSVGSSSRSSSSNANLEWCGVAVVIELVLETRCDFTYRGTDQEVGEGMCPPRSSRDNPMILLKCSDNDITTTETSRDSSSLGFNSSTQKPWDLGTHL